MIHRRRRQSAFTLVEMAIVVSIIGLLAGGVIAGKNLMHTAELRSVGVDLTRYATAVKQFREQYGSIPGDMPNATRFWGVTAGNGTGTDTTCYDATSVTGSTCNGNGNGSIDSGIGTGSGGEMNLFWQHLGLAGLVESKSPGGSGPPTSCGSGTACPNNGAFPGSGYTVITSYYQGGWGETFSHETDGLILFFGRFGSTTDMVWRQPLLSAPDQAYIDAKIDDGKPDTGLMVTQNNTTSCFTGSYPNAAYLVSSAASNVCILRYTVKFL